MSKRPLPTPLMFAVHRRAVILTQFRWQVVAETTEAMARLQRIIGDLVLPALQRFAEELENVEIDGAEDENNGQA